MVSGWDKTPGKGNDYASTPGTRTVWVGLAVVIMMLAIALGVALS